MKFDEVRKKLDSLLLERVFDSLPRPSHIIKTSAAKRPSNESVSHPASEPVDSRKRVQLSCASDDDSIKRTKSDVSISSNGQSLMADIASDITSLHTTNARQIPQFITKPAASDSRREALAAADANDIRFTVDHMSGVTRDNSHTCEVNQLSVLDCCIKSYNVHSDKASTSVAYQIFDTVLNL